MIEALNGPGGTVFGVCLALMLGLFVLELIAALFGGNPIDHLIPDFSSDLHLDGAHGVELHGMAGGFLAWLHVGRVPIMILLAAFLSAWGASGLLVQSLSQGMLGFYLPALLVVPMGFAVGLFATHVIGQFLSRVMPSDETAAVSPAQFIGQLAIITQGTARQGLSAEARLVDAHGRTHYLRVEPMNETPLEPGTEVLLLERKDALFLVVPATEVSP